jgi:hypothetical protein
MRRLPTGLLTGPCVFLLLASGHGAVAQTFTFSTNDPDGLVATASRPGGAVLEIESADDFILPTQTILTSGSFTGLIPTGSPLSDVSQVRVEIYRVFPKDSTNPPSGSVPTRVNSPSDVAFDSRETGFGTLTFSTTLLNAAFTANNSILNGINPIPGQTTGGEGSITGQEVRFDFTLATPLSLPADHYFFIPQVQLASGEFFWLSAPKPIVAPGTPFAPDLQSWLRNGNLDPDWLRVGTDVLGAGAFNAAFSLNGTAVPEPGVASVFAVGVMGTAILARKRRAA